ncbi:unnamed protein product [Rotaria sp. Silwood1]|nr:unnamed protein product [Rotaria sp. Silwood1]CAF4998500.1 unnamed protein product [Rotaria sp. Silwood1]
MQKISQQICLIILLVLVATSKMAQATAIEDVDGNGIAQHAIKKRQACAYKGSCCNPANCPYSLCCGGAPANCSPAFGCSGALCSGTCVVTGPLLLLC